MQDPIHQLYQNQAYPPMSHPLSDPAVSAVAARMVGLQTPEPRSARILEIGCCSGHHLIPLARRWPEARFTGIDLAETSIDEARERAAAAGVGNIDFLAADLMDFEPEDGPFDFIIAHGFFSWVPDEVKAALLVFCRKHLALSGIATVSFNLECGWLPRLPVIAKVRAIQQAGGGDIVSSLGVLRMVTEPASPEIAIIDDMLAKGPAILAFDDFGPVNDPWPLDRFVRAAANAGLRWLGESDPGENVPAALDDAEIRSIRQHAKDPLTLQTAMDEAAGRTFRSGVLCRDDAPVLGRMPAPAVLDLHLRAGRTAEDPFAKELHRVIGSFAAASVPAEKIFVESGGENPELFARQILTGITRGWISPRIEAVDFNRDPPEFPKLDAFRLLCARRGLPLVDALHKPCAFPAGHFQVLAAMDGSRSREELATISKSLCPELAFEPWLQHLAQRGMFS
jgi:SAM-dependent methyltransferase